jgi:tetratricopeptide (TPR) repeat protein
METQLQVGTPKAARGGMRGRSLTRWSGSVSAFLPAVALFAISLSTPQGASAQQWPGSGSRNPGFPQTNFPRNGSPMGPDPGNPITTDSLEAMESGFGVMRLMPLDNSRLINDESCQTWTAAAVTSPTVSVARLQVPGRASHEFQKACGDFKDEKLNAAEEHARKAVKLDPDYAAAWVLLGQILHADHKDPEAIEACQSAKKADPKYAPPYICLAGFAASANDWDEAYSLSNQALSLDPASDPYAYLYTATADFHLKHVDQAELYAKSAEKLDKWNHIPEVHILLAQIYEVKGQPSDEVRELRKFLKNSPHNADWQAARTHLGEVERGLSK